MIKRLIIAALAAVLLTVPAYADLALERFWYCLARQTAAEINLATTIMKGGSGAGVSMPANSGIIRNC